MLSHKVGVTKGSLRDVGVFTLTLKLCSESRLENGFGGVLALLLEPFISRDTGQVTLPATMKVLMAFNSLPDAG